MPSAERIAGRAGPPLDYDHVPACTFSDPEIGSVGLTEAEARERGYDEFLPWSIVDSGLSFEFLKTEHEKAREALSSLPCPAVEKCTTCGVCPSTWLADAPPSLIQIQPAKIKAAMGLTA